MSLEILLGLERASQNCLQLLWERKKKGDIDDLKPHTLSPTRSLRAPFSTFRYNL